MTLSVAPSKKWWKDAVVYQIYPASFLDSDGDGLGDLQGIISKLDYIQSLGVSAIWLSPIYKSPQNDMGYDVADYRNIHQPYGSMEDMDLLIHQCHERQIKVLLDLVVNHTSNEHPWFLESRSSRTATKRDWYIWRDPKYGLDGSRKPPNNWASIFGGSAWTWDEMTGQYYLSLFLPSQPHLNWENESMRQATHADMIFWLDKGVDGFRIDSMNLMSKHSDLPDAPIVNPNSDFQPGDKYFASGPQLNMVFTGDIVDMDFGPGGKYERNDFQVSRLRAITSKWQNAMPKFGGWNAVYLDNHDSGRSLSRYASDLPQHRVNAAKMLATYMGTLSGTLFLLQGQEIGMTNIPDTWGVEDYIDVEGSNYYNSVLERRGEGADMTDLLREMRLKARDNGRLPMQWNSNKNAGFTEGGKPWMRVNDDYKEWNVEKQVGDKNSVLEYWREVLALRKSESEVFTYGHYEELDVARTGENVFAYTMTSFDEQKKALVLLNFSDMDQRFDTCGFEGWSTLLGRKTEVGVGVGRSINGYGCYEVRPPQQQPSLDRWILARHWDDRDNRHTKSMTSRCRAKTVKVKQACDSCRLRKIRCDGAWPCANCAAAALSCTFLAVHKKTGPKGGRRRPRSFASPVSDSVRAGPSNLHHIGSSLPGFSSILASVSVHNGIETPAPVGTFSLDPVLDDVFAKGECGFQPSPALTTEVVSLCLDAFFEHKSPITPILDQKQMKDALLSYTTTPELYSLLAACCSVMVLSPGLLGQTSPHLSQPFHTLSTPLPSPILSPTGASNSPVAMPPPRLLISEVIRARSFSGYIEKPSLNSVQTSFFLFSAYFCLGEDNSAWFYLREAITLLQLLRFHEESTYAVLYATNPLTATYARRTFWVLFVTERAYALQRNRVLTLQASIDLPSAKSDRDALILMGFVNLISLFRDFDDEFVNLWNQPFGTSPSEKPLVKLQNRLAYALPTVSGCTKGQLADLLVSREWLKTIVWQLCVSRAMLSSSSSEESMSFRYPVAIARDIVLVSRLLPPEAFAANGMGILEKITDIGCSLSDVLSLEPGFAGPSTLEIGPRDSLAELVRIVSSFGSGYKKLQILASKAAGCLRTSIERPLNDVADEIDETGQIYGCE
ncbi:uncharacterized protein E0L32_002181 [Thyridium curvatum]|uniref:Zn(2)-C6 fungal-type domain-containing protein n=1 Tax=Thyridium curvatum TaxID=1093900 RepID=A0A507AR31_9PEZI|nr:uncharacterized protein E0L32_001952 [Thyridium curvatum]XP_030989289.1 uncharacterized protein E0L32_002181 [Thyridium curvatum]TPX07349.1 hypothetical protein E0L32_001952 [Thyridium curvatum]TPX07578.1 hypothetical protein E0L32_002181 [Thyridium curvatum]